MRAAPLGAYFADDLPALAEAARASAEVTHAHPDGQAGAVARHLGDYAEALWTTVSGLGDRDTTCAIVGGIVALSAGADSIPEEWLRCTEPVPALPALET